MTSTDEQRWADAEAVLRRDVDGPARVRVRRRRRRVTWLLLGGPLLGGLTAGLIGGLTAGHRHHDHHVGIPAWRTGLSIGLEGIGVLLAIVAFVLLVRGNQWKATWRSPLFQLTRSQRKSLLRQVRGKEAVDDRHLPLALYLADRLAYQRRVQLVFPALLVMWAGQTVLAVDAFHLAILGAYCVLVATAVPAALRSAARGERFLDRYGAVAHQADEARPDGSTAVRPASS